MSDLSKSPKRNTFQMENYLRRCKEDGKEPNAAYIKMYEDASVLRLAKEVDPKWTKHNLEHDLRSSDWMLDKVRSSNVYAQNLYAAMCNNTFQEIEMWQILTDQSWGCSWRYAGGIIADMQQKGDYIDWYCSGIQSNPTAAEYMSMTDQEKEIADRLKDYVGEGMVTDEVREDLRKLGWVVL
jgi:hypothetical protein